MKVKLVIAIHLVFFTLAVLVLSCQDTRTSRYKDHQGIRYQKEHELINIGARVEEGVRGDPIVKLNWEAKYGLGIPSYILISKFHHPGNGEMGEFVRTWKVLVDPDTNAIQELTDEDQLQVGEHYYYSFHAYWQGGVFDFPYKMSYFTPDWDDPGNSTIDLRNGGLVDLSITGIKIKIQ